jgi:hypothetical protein
MENLKNKLTILLEDTTLVPEEKTFLQNVITQLENFGKFISDLFKRTTKLVVAKHDSLKISKKNEKELWQVIEEREEKAGNVKPWHDNDIVEYFDGQLIPATDGVTATISRFTKTLTHTQILNEGDRLGIKKIHTWLEAYLLIRQAVLNNEVDVKGTGVIAYFKVKDNDTLYRFIAFRDVDGQLSVNVSKVNPGRWVGCWPRRLLRLNLIFLNL